MLHKKVKNQQGFTLINCGTIKGSHSGFTLIELIIYMAIVSVITVSMIDFALTMILGGVKSSVEQEVYTQSRYVSERIKLEIRNATDINSVTPTQISLKEPSVSGKDPTIISLSGGKINIQQGTGTAIALNSTDTSVGSLTFTNLTSVDNKTKNIQFIFTMNSNYSSSRQEYNENLTIESSAELRGN